MLTKERLGSAGGISLLLFLMLIIRVYVTCNLMMSYQKLVLPVKDGNCRCAVGFSCLQNNAIFFSNCNIWYLLMYSYTYTKQCNALYTLTGEVYFERFRVHISTFQIFNCDDAKFMLRTSWDDVSHCLMWLANVHANECGTANYFFKSVASIVKVWISSFIITLFNLQFPDET